jgi:undecaprenyl-diphosphatase
MPLPTVNGFDSLLMFPYSEPLSITSDMTQYISFFTPAAFALVAPPSEGLEISLLYGTSALLSFGTRTLMKKTIERIRPYMYDSNPPGDMEDYNESFPSGHSIMAFTGAAFTHALFALRYPDSPYRVPVTIAAWTFASATAALRVASGNHFVTDVLAGAAIGSFFGFAVPYLAWKFLPSWQGDRISVAVGPTTMAMNIRF